MNSLQPEAMPDVKEVADRPTVQTAFRRLADEFRRNDIASPALDARLLVSSACGLSHEQFVAQPGRELSAAEAARIERLRARRLAGEPVSRLLGVREFWGLPFALTRDVLDPRPETETVVATSLELASRMPAGADRPRILDLGTGSGSVLLALLTELAGATGVGSDISIGAVAAARANAEQLGVAPRARFFCGCWLDGVSGPFDLVVSNPPYVRSGDIAGLAPEVAGFDPRAALDGGADGLDCYRRIAPRLAKVLRPGGWAVLEAGAGQADAIAELLRLGGLGLAPADRLRARDLSGHVRCVAARLPERRG